MSQIIAQRRLVRCDGCGRQFKTARAEPRCTDIHCRSWRIRDIPSHGSAWDEPTYQFIIRRVRELIAADEENARVDAVLELGQHMLQQDEADRWLDESLNQEVNSREVRHKMRQEAQMTEMAVETMKGATDEFRAGRRDIEELGVEYLDENRPPPELVELETSLAWLARLRVLDEQIAALEVESRSGPNVNYYRAALVKAVSARKVLYERLSPPTPTEAPQGKKKR